MSQEQLKMNVDITQSTPMTSTDGNQIFQEAVVLRKISKFLAGTSEDAVIPIPVFIDVKTGKILIDMLPKELKEEYEIYNNK
tara:strand:+ start:833 stop:1078 length:246 start_codon:yes stop_codon:yes gene_type:complete